MRYIDNRNIEPEFLSKDISVLTACVRLMWIRQR